MFFQELLAIFVAALKIDNPVRKQLAEIAISNLAIVLDSAQKVDTVLDQPGVSKGMISGLIKLAQLFGNDRDLTDDQKQQIKDVGGAIIDISDNPDAEAAIEALFFNLVDALDAFQELVNDENTTEE